MVMQPKAKVKVRSNTAQYPVLGICSKRFTFHLFISTYLGSIKPCCNYWTKNVRADIHLNL